ncbi:MAG: hypothetical protein R3Y39_08535 [Rikenellaceae bacterium]
MDITSIVISIGSLILGGGGVGAFMYYRENKRAKHLDNERKVLDNTKEQAEQWKNLYLEAERKSQAKSAKMETLYNTIGKKNTEITKLNGRLSRVGLLRCDEVGCPARKPPINTMSTELDEK